MSKKFVLIFYGAPGSGKGTQANLFAEKLGLIHFDTGRFLESVLHDEKNKNNLVIQKERELFDSGVLNTPSWVLKIVKQNLKKIAKKDKGVIFSGSPRTLFEAEGLMPLLEELYGKENIFICNLEINPEISVQRNIKRLICSFCGSILLTNKFKFVDCPLCGAKLVKRVLDNPKATEIRINEYKKRTMPIFDYVKKHNYQIIRVKADKLPYEVFKNIYGKIFSKIK